MKTEMPDPHDLWVVNNFGMGLRETAVAHLAAIRVLREADEPYGVELGPLDDDWLTLVASLGTWVRGPAEEVKRFIDAWREEAGEMGVAIAPYINR